MIPPTLNLLVCLKQAKVDFVIVGGFATAIHGCTLVTQEIIAEDCSLRVLRIDSLIKAKEVMNRPQDQAAVSQLQAILNLRSQ